MQSADDILNGIYNYIDTDFGCSYFQYVAHEQDSATTGAGCPRGIAFFTASPRGGNMEKKESPKPNDRFVRVKDREGNEFVCPARALMNPDELTEEEKSRCVDAAPPRGLVSPIG